MKIVVGLTGASGSILFKRTIEILNSLGHNIIVLATDNGKNVFEYELEEKFDDFVKQYKSVKVEDINNMFSSVASGSSDIDKMIVVPCSMGTVGNIANGTSNNLLIRCADVFLKEKKTVVLAMRETPLNNIHLNNLILLNNYNVHLVFQVPSFYNKREKLNEVIDDMVFRNLKYLGIELPNDMKWKSKL